MKRYNYSNSFLIGVHFFLKKAEQNFTCDFLKYGSLLSYEVFHVFNTDLNEH